MSTATLPAPSTPIRAEADWLEPVLRAVAKARVAVFGDCCVDAYWWLSPAGGEVSVETGLTAARVDRQAYSLGAAGNVAANVSALGVAATRLVGVAGPDCFGGLLRRLVAEAGIDGSGLVDGGSAWQTMVYAKPMRGGHEEPRLDFGAINRVDAELASAIAAALERAVAASDAVVINRQVGGVLAAPDVVAAVNAVIARHPGTVFLVDARSGADGFAGVALKLNVQEACRLAGRAAGQLDEAEVRELALALHRRAGRPVFITRGERGLVVAAEGRAGSVPGIVAGGAVDPVGAGDTVVAALAAALGAGVEPALAARFANLAAAVTVRKLHTTGTASPDELRARAAGCDHLHAPELAEDRRRARFLTGSEIEVVRERPAGAGAIAHAIFDHDGTISTLRQGWEAVMEPMMVRAVLGPRCQDAPAELYRQVLAAVKEMIDRTTGIQTLAQMQELVALVRRFGCVPEDEVLDHHGYKRIYNDALMEQVRVRMARLESGELEPADFQIKGAVRLLQRLKAAGVRLYLASGTDQADVIAEAAAMGYAGLFDGGIHGAVGNLAVEAKRDVMDRITRGNGIDGARLLVVGDGPVEMREGRRRGALCLGVASDEPRRYGLDPVKRTRLIRAGADLILGDFSQLDRLLPAIGLA